MRKYIPILIIAIACVAYFVFNASSIGIFKPLFVVSLIAGIACAFVWAMSRRKIPPETLAKDFARLIRKMIDKRMIFGVFVFSDGWWRLFCMKDEDDPDGETIGEWTLPEIEGMIENGVSMMFRDGHLDKKLLTEGVADVSVGYVTIEEGAPQSIAISITYDEKA